MRPKQEPARVCKMCGEVIPMIKGDYCDECMMKLKKEGKPPLFICKECGEVYGEEKVRKGLNGKMGSGVEWKTAKCDICGKKRKVTHYRHYGYLTRGHLAKAIDRDKIQDKLLKKFSSKKS